MSIEPDEGKQGTCVSCGNGIFWHHGAWWHSASVFSLAPAALDPFAAQLDNDHDPRPSSGEEGVRSDGDA